jgi:enoyl-CoA hydratase/carnithine racemase
VPSTPTVTTGVDTVLSEFSDGVVTITLNRPARLNAVTPVMIGLFAERLRAADADPEVRVIVLTGAGRGFCAGADLSVLQTESDELRRFITDPTAFPTAVLHVRKPVVAAVNGPAAGVGLHLLAGADVRFGASTSTFTAPFARLGLVAEYGASWLLARLVGPAHATDMLLSGRTVDAEEARRMGLLTAVVPTHEVLDHATEYAREIARHCSPRALAAVKQQVRADWPGAFSAAFDRSLTLMVDSIDRPDFGEALAALRNGRPPRFPPLTDLDRKEDA